MYLELDPQPARRLAKTIAEPIRRKDKIERELDNTNEKLGIRSQNERDRNKESCGAAE